jgi:hypothetical protein
MQNKDTLHLPLNAMLSSDWDISMAWYVYLDFFIFYCQLINDCIIIIFKLKKLKNHGFVKTNKIFKLKTLENLVKENKKIELNPFCIKESMLLFLNNSMLYLWTPWISLTVNQSISL